MSREKDKYIFKKVDLDTLFSSIIVLNSDMVTCNASFRLLSGSMNAKPEHFIRDGLGTWAGFAVDVENHGRILFAVPYDAPALAARTQSLEEDKKPPQERWGASIWVENTPKINADMVIDFIITATGNKDILFANPTTGQKIVRVGRHDPSKPRHQSPPKP